MGKYTGIDVLIGSHLSLNAVQTRLTPRLGSFVSVIEEELEFAMKEEFPALNRGEPSMAFDYLSASLRSLSLSLYR